MSAEGVELLRKLSDKQVLASTRFAETMDGAQLGGTERQTAEVSWMEKASQWLKRGNERSILPFSVNRYLHARDKPDAPPSPGVVNAQSVA